MSRTPFWLVVTLLVIVTGVAAIGLLTFNIDPEAASGSHELPVAMHSSIKADYQADSHSLVIQPVAISLVGQALQDAETVSGNPSSSLEQLIGELETPVPYTGPPGAPTPKPPVVEKTQINGNPTPGPVVATPQPSAVPTKNDPVVPTATEAKPTEKPTHVNTPNPGAQATSVTQPTNDNKPTSVTKPTNKPDPPSNPKPTKKPNPPSNPKPPSDPKPTKQPKNSNGNGNKSELTWPVISSDIVPGNNRAAPPSPSFPDNLLLILESLLNS